MFQEMRDTLQELWAADLIDVDTHRVFVQRGHRVRTTMRGYQLWCEWQRESSNHDQERPWRTGQHHRRLGQGHVPALAHSSHAPRP